MKIAVVTYARIDQISFFYIYCYGRTIYLSACFIIFYKYVSFEISLLLLVYLLVNYFVPKMLICVIMSFC